MTTLSYGPRPERASEHIEIDQSLPSLPQTWAGVAKLILHRFASVELQAPATVAALQSLAGREFDIVVANEARSLPLAFRVGGSPKIWCDLHEWAPAERTHVLSWRLLVAPFMDWVCRTYLPRVDAASTVNESIAKLYLTDYGVTASVVRNAIAYRSDLSPSPMRDGVIRLVHSGGAVPGRNIEAIVDAVEELGEGYTLDLFLVPSRQAEHYWRRLVERIDASTRSTLHPAVAPAELPAALNAFDLGVYLLPPQTPNHRLMLPNKFFDFVQARLGIVFGPAVETDRLIHEHGLGIVASGFEPADLAEAIRGLSPDRVAGFKQATDRAAAALSSAADVEAERDILRALSAT
ncbi:hypothetical protein [Microbacterium terrisoli]|uniref:hypothetical protein n=1 Tax=Microbacterium terrisoli TaxID=3242192 RepID=UPI00280527D5|nr:hypothetical protein [Microbacterium protaetiae]